MAHEVTAKFHTKIVQRKDVEIEVKTGTDNNKSKLGTLLISQGNIEWLPKGFSKNKKRLTWAQFADLMMDRGKPVKAK